MTQQQLAAEAGVTDAYIAQLETGVRVNPSTAVLERLATILRIGAEVLAATGRQGAPVELRLYALDDYVSRRAEGRMSQALANSLGHWLRTLELLRVALIEFEEVRRALVTANDDLQSAIKTGEHAAIWAGFARYGRVSTMVYMRTEIFFYFGKTLIDRVADTVREYFGLPVRLGGSSHFELIKLIQDAGIAVPAKTASIAEEVGRKVVTVKTKMFEHFAHPRELRTPIIGADGTFRMQQGGGLVGPAGEHPSMDRLQAEDPRQLLGLIEAYAGEMAELIKRNVVKRVPKRVRRTRRRS